MKINISPEEMKKFAKKAAKFPVNFEKVFDEGLKDLGGRLLGKVIKRTPAGNSIKGLRAYRDKKGNYAIYKKGKNSGQYKLKKMTTHIGGNLRRSWYATKPIKKETRKIVVVYNTAPYSRYVEYGHRQTPGRFVPAIGKRLKASWVKGRFMLTKSEEEVDAIKEKVLERKLNQEIKRIWK